jgi:hypothetical protein
VIPHYIRLSVVGTPTTATSVRGAVTIDLGSRGNAGGTDLTTAIVNSHTGLSTASIVDVCRFGAVVPTAVVTPRTIANFLIKTQAAPCLTAGDEIIFNFLSTDNQGGQNIAGAAAVSITKNIGPVVLAGANHCLMLHLWYPAVTVAPTYEIEAAWWER